MLAATSLCAVAAAASAQTQQGASREAVKAWADKTIEASGWTYMGVVGRSAAPFALYMTEGPRSPDVKRAIWLRNEYMVQTNGYRSLQALLDIDCDTKLVRIKTSIAFKENNLKSRLSSDDQPSPWQPAQGGSVLSGVVEDTCRSGAATTAAAAASAAPTAIAAAGETKDATPRAHPVDDAMAQTQPALTPPAPASSPATAPGAGAPATASSTPSGGASAAERLRLAAADQAPLRPRALSAPNTIGRRRAAAVAAETGSPARDGGAAGSGPRIQLGAYGSRTLAEEASQRLRRRDAAAFSGRIAQIEPFASSKGQVWRLLLGPFADARAAGAACKAVQDQGGECLVRR